MLNKDYKKRPNIKTVLEHPWLNPKTVNEEKK